MFRHVVSKCLAGLGTGLAGLGTGLAGVGESGDDVGKSGASVARSRAGLGKCRAGLGDDLLLKADVLFGRVFGVLGEFVEDDFSLWIIADCRPGSHWFLVLCDLCFQVSDECGL